MDWLALSIISSVFFALSNVIDKQIIGRYLRGPAACAVQPLFVLFWIFLLGKRHLSAHETGIENIKPVALGTVLIMGGIYLIS